MIHRVVIDATLSSAQGSQSEVPFYEGSRSLLFVFRGLDDEEPVTFGAVVESCMTPERAEFASAMFGQRFYVLELAVPG